MQREYSEEILTRGEMAYETYSSLLRKSSVKSEPVRPVPTETGKASNELLYLTQILQRLMLELDESGKPYVKCSGNCFNKHVCFLIKMSPGKIFLSEIWLIASKEPSDCSASVPSELWHPS